MHFYDQTRLAAYMEHDAVAEGLRQAGRDGDAQLVCQQWLQNSEAKRLIYHDLYGDLAGLAGTAPRGLRVLDVGGGLTALTRRLVERHAYDLIDVMAHDPQEVVDAFLREQPRPFWVASDWYGFEPAGTWDVVIANDLFPNVDQRLCAFIEKMLPHCAEMRLSLTYYDNGRFYPVRRIGGEEVMCMMAWTGAQTRAALEPFEQRIEGGLATAWPGTADSLFANGRQVAGVVLRGDARPGA